MKKYDEWNEVKKSTQNSNRKLGIKSREVFWVKIGHNIGDEEYGKGEVFSRPVIIVSQLTADLFVGIPTTTANKENNDYFENIKYTDIHKNIINSTAMIYQFRTYSKKRITSKVGKVGVEEFKKIQVKLEKLLFPPTKSRTQ